MQYACQVGFTQTCGLGVNDCKILSLLAMLWYLPLTTLGADVTDSVTAAVLEMLMMIAVYILMKEASIDTSETGLL